MPKEKITEQLRRNAVALISLVIAITSLGYNTWRNEHTEDNRNQRWASFEILLKLGELRELINYIHFDCNLSFRGNPRSGWVIVEAIEDLTLILEDMTPESASRLKSTWSDNWRGLEYASAAACEARDAARRAKGMQSVESIRAEIDVLRKDVIDILYSLD